MDKHNVEYVVDYNNTWGVLKELVKVNSTSIEFLQDKTSTR